MAVSGNETGAVEERVVSLDEENWKLEAEGVINDVKAHVTYIQVSSKIKNSNTHIYLNIMTIEGEEFCVEMSAAGFRIVGNAFDDKSNPQEKVFETPHSILDDISPKYRASFGNALMGKLQNLQREMNEKQDTGD
ncbi:GSK3B-interacting protein [Anabrus simplex]|uniref:GSK3B-interacting protein n=1 Tax=Anabrus simplex TaxID=316456 RepID=UPI0035A3A619